MQKKCKKCGEEKPVWEFHRTTKEGVFVSNCKECAKSIKNSGLNAKLTEKLGYNDSPFNIKRKKLCK